MDSPAGEIEVSIPAEIRAVAIDEQLREALYILILPEAPALRRR